MRIYIAGPMRGIPYYNFPAFDAMQALLEKDGVLCVNPANLDREIGFEAMELPPDTDWTAIPDGFDFAACVDRDVREVRRCDAIMMLDGWEKSSGARAEKALAEWEGKAVMYQTPPCGTATAQPVEIRVTDASTGGQKGSKMARFDLLPWDAMWFVAELYGRGATKYAERNWEKGYSWHLSHAALMRHLTQFWQLRERNDSETQSHHLACVAFHALAMLSFDIRGIGTDDRPAAPKP